MLEVKKRSPIDATWRNLLSTMRNEPFLPMLGDFEEETMLPLDVSEKDGEVIVRASMPGFKKDEIDIEVQEGILTIRAEHSEEKETKDEKFYRKERRYGAVNRSVQLPGIVSGDKADAELKNGVLTVRIPEVEERKPRRVSIK